MKTAIVYKSLTGNTRIIADAVADALSAADVVYCGPPDGLPGGPAGAELYFIGSWTDKGMCDIGIAAFLKTLQNKKIAVFGTAGFGGSQDYFDKLFQRVKEGITADNTVLGGFYCQGKMPAAVRERYASLLSQHPEDNKLAASIRNFDDALAHPDQEDIAAAMHWARSIYERAQVGE